MAVRIATIAVLIALAAPARGGVYYSGESFAEFPSQWRGFLPDQRLLRTLAAPPGPKQPANPLREPYTEAAAKLAALTRPLTADEAADLGALRIRLGRLDAALEGLRAAQRQFPEHFRLTANLATVWLLRGDYDQALQTQRHAVRLAPPALKPVEDLQLKLVRLRRGEPANRQALDDLFGVRYANEPAAERKKLPADAVASLQRLALALPADGRLLWQLGELAHLFGDTRTAAAILDGCVTEFGMSDADLRRRRIELRTLAEKLAKEQPRGRGDAQQAHDGGHASLVFRSPRPLPRRLDGDKLPTVRADGVNPLPWWLLAETTLDRNFRPRFAKHLRELDGKRVSLLGFMQPIGDDLETGLFLLIEYPVGCWFCEVPEPVGIVLVEMPENKSTMLTRSAIKVEGTLSLNSADPEQFLFTVRSAKVGAVD